eukprot:2492184-Rhodomonas_salina.2
MRLLHADLLRPPLLQRLELRAQPLAGLVQPFHLFLQLLQLRLEVCDLAHLAVPLPLHPRYLLSQALGLPSTRRVRDEQRAARKCAARCVWCSARVTCWAMSERCDAG